MKKDNWNFLSKVCTIISVFLIISIILLCIPLTIPRLMNYNMYTVVSGSMAPAIPVGGMVYVRNVPAADIQSGDIVVFYEEQGSNAIVTHRVVENNVAGGVLTTKGDANEQNDPRPVTYDRYVGKVVRSIPYVGFLSTILTDFSGKIGIASLIFFAVVLFLVGETLGGKKKTEKPEKPTAEKQENLRRRRKKMTDRQFRSLNRRELIEIIYYIETKMNLLQSENASMKRELEELRRLQYGIEERKQKE